MLGKYNDDNGKTYIGLVYLTKNNTGIVNNSVLDTNVNVLSNSIGPDYTDNTTDEMNSHDVFDENVNVMRFQVTQDFVTDIESNEFNQNADMSYLPQYPGISGECDIYKTRLSSDEYYNIELLGSSKNIDRQIGMVNTETDPYFDQDKLLENETFGMVFEEFDENDKYRSFYKHLNPSLNNSKQTPDVLSGYNCYYDHVDLS